MDPAHLNIRQQLDKIVKYLTPLLPMANCHMVEFFTENHWERFIPEDVKKEVDKIGFSDATEIFWQSAYKGNIAGEETLPMFSVKKGVIE